MAQALMLSCARFEIFDKKRAQTMPPKPLILLVGAQGFEPWTR